METNYIKSYSIAAGFAVFILIFQVFSIHEFPAMVVALFLFSAATAVYVWIVQRFIGKVQVFLRVELYANVCCILSAVGVGYSFFQAIKNAGNSDSEVNIYFVLLSIAVFAISELISRQERHCSWSIAQDILVLGLLPAGVAFGLGCKFLGVEIVC